MSEAIKNIVTELFDIAAKVGASKDENTDREEQKKRQLAKKEILNFLLYLSAADGSIEVAEALFI